MINLITITDLKDGLELSFSKFLDKNTETSIQLKYITSVLFKNNLKVLDISLSRYFTQKRNFLINSKYNKSQIFSLTL